MPVPTETLYNIPRLNVIFAISSLLLLASMGWMVIDDHDRRWREHQQEFMDLQASVSRLDYLTTQTARRRDRWNTLQAAVTHAREAYDAQADQAAGLREELQAEEVKLADISIEFGNRNARIAVTKAHYEELKTLKGESDPETIEARRRYDAEQEELAEVTRKKEESEDARRRIRRRMKELRAELTQAEKDLASFRKEADELKQKSETLASPIKRTIFNLPMADFAAPKGTTGREEIRQVVLPDVRRNYNFLESYSVDRCQTCHLGIDDEAFTLDSGIARMSEALPAINEGRSRRGLPPLPVPPEPEPDEFGRVTHEQKREYFRALTETVNVHLEAEGFEPIEMKQPYWAHPRLDLYVTPDSPHPVSKMGCTVCHEGNGQETDFILASHTPHTHEMKEHWEAEYMPKVGRTDFKTVEHYWDYPMLLPEHVEANCTKCHSEITDIAVHENKPLASTINEGYQLYRQLGCINCHLVEGLGHYRRVGTDLSFVGSKVTRRFMHEWIHAPKEFRPSTWMPHFFMQENNGPGCEAAEDPEPILRTQTEVMAITEYLLRVSEPFDPEPIPDDLTSDVERGRQLFGDVGCLACHSAIEHRLGPGPDAETIGEKWIVEDLTEQEGLSRDEALKRYQAMTYNERIVYCMTKFPNDWDTIYHPERTLGRPVFTRYAPEISAIRTKFESDEKAVAWLYDWVRDPQHYFPGTKMPSMRLTPQESLDIAVYLATFNANEEFNRRVAASRIKDTTDYRRKIDELMFVMLSGQNSAAMCRSIINDEKNQLTEMLVGGLRRSMGESRARELFEPMDLQDKRAMFVGSKAITHYGCYACHRIAGFETATRPGTELTTWGFKELSKLDFGYYDTAFERERGPEFDHLYPVRRTDLIASAGGENPHEQIEHNRGAFAWHKLRNPRIYDRKKIKGPYEKLKMPNFFLDDEQADALVTYLLSRRPPLINDSLKIDYQVQPTGRIAEGRNLVRDLNCMGCHKIENNAAVVHQYFTKTEAGETSFDETNAPPWLRGEGAKVQHPWFYSFLSNVEPLRPWLKIRMPTFTLNNDEATTLVEYFAGLVMRESDMLSERLKPIEKYVARKQEEAGPNADDEDLPPGSDWYAQPELAEIAAALAEYAVDNQLANPYDVNLNDPDLTHEDWAPTFEEIRTSASFLRDLYQVNYPYVDSPRPEVSEERFKLGEELFTELSCLSCHVLGDPNAEGSNPAPSAPNLNLTHRRLGHEWFHRWLQEPGIIQPGSKMPQWFGGAGSAFGDYPPEDRRAMGTKFGTTGEEQMSLLMDFIYDAGIRNYTAILPPGSLTPAAEEAQEPQED